MSVHHVYTLDISRHGDNSALRSLQRFFGCCYRANHGAERELQHSHFYHSGEHTAVAHEMLMERPQGVVWGSELSGAATVVAAPDANIHRGNEEYANECH